MTISHGLFVKRKRRISLKVRLLRFCFVFSSSSFLSSTAESVGSTELDAAFLFYPSLDSSSMIASQFFNLCPAYFLDDILSIS